MVSSAASPIMRSVPKSKPSNNSSSSSFFSCLRRNNQNNPPLLFVSLVTSALFGGDDCSSFGGGGGGVSGGGGGSRGGGGGRRLIVTILVTTVTIAHALLDPRRQGHEPFLHPMLSIPHHDRIRPLSHGRSQFGTNSNSPPSSSPMVVVSTAQICRHTHYATRRVFDSERSNRLNQNDDIGFEISAKTPGCLSVHFVNDSRWCYHSAHPLFRDFWIHGSMTMRPIFTKKFRRSEKQDCRNNDEHQRLVVMWSLEIIILSPVPPLVLPEQQIEDC